MVIIFKENYADYATIKNGKDESDKSGKEVNARMKKIHGKAFEKNPSSY